MGYRLREFDAECKLISELTVEAIGRAVPRTDVEAVIEETGTQQRRERKLCMVAIVFLVIAMGLYSRLSIGAVMRRLAQGLRFVWRDPSCRLPRDSALTYRRYQLGARPLVELFHRVCRPMTTPQTRGAFLFGLRMMAIDGTVEDVPDTPDNAAVFGRHRGRRGHSAFPQLRGVYLAECGSHAIVDAGFWPFQVSERVGGFRMLRSVGPGMLVMWDRGFHDYDMLARARGREAHMLSRLPAHVKPQRMRRLLDGSYLAYLRPSDDRRRRQGERLWVRIIQYTLTDPASPGYGETHRLVTSLLDPQTYPALDLACAYHQRWEIELVIDEVDTHQRLVGRPLRSLKPVGVIQELYGLLIAHYAVRFLMHEAAHHTDLDPDRLSFVHALRVIADAIPEFQMVALDQLEQLHTRLLCDIAEGRIPERRQRSNPRVVKRKMSSFRLKRPEHQHWPQPTLSFRQSVELI